MDLKPVISTLIFSLFALLPALLAHRKGRGFIGWWVFGYFFPVLALPFALLVPRNRKRTDSAEFKKWPAPRAYAIAAGLALGLSTALFSLKAHVVEARYIPSESMAPTLVVGDRLAVDKVVYRFSSPQRGDVVVFNPPDPHAVGSNPHIKRIVALPGETVAFKKGKLFVDGRAQSERYILEDAQYAEPDWKSIGMPGGKVPADSYFVLGDNRNNSQDSHTFGPVSRTHLIGRAGFRFWPMARVGGL